MMQYYIKVTKNNKTTRVVTPTHVACTEIQKKILALDPDKGYTVDARVYEYNGVLVRSSSELQAAARILKILITSM